MTRLPFRQRLFFRLLAWGIAAAASAAASAPPPDSDLPVDFQVAYGALSNGVRYVLRPGTGSGGRLSLRLVVDAGSLDEADNQRGLAHLLEHMAFNGSDHFPAGTVLEFLQRQGMAIGADANANTTFDRTTYLLELRHNDPAAINQGLDIFRDFAGGLFLPAAALAKERTVVLSEKLARDSVMQRIQEEQLNFCLAGTLLPRRITIGDPDIIAHADREQLKAFYDAWYRPDRLTVVAVGDFDQTAMAAAIKAHFGHLRARARAIAPPPFGHIENAPGIHVKYLGQQDLPGVSVNFTVLHEGPAPADSAQTRLQDLPRQMAFLMFNRRLNEVASRPGAPFIQGRSVCAERLNLFEETALGVAAAGRNWQPALTAAEHELRRALLYGFQPAELKVATAVFAQQLEQEVRAAPTRPAGLIANALIENLKAGQTFVAPADLLTLYTPALSQMSVATCNRAFVAAWQSPARFVTVAGSSGGPADSDAAVAKVYAEEAAAPVAENVADEVAPWSYLNFGTPAPAPGQHTVGFPPVILADFPNGIRVNLKTTRFEANRIRVRLRVGTGLLQEPVREPGLGLLTEQSFLAGGLKRYRETEIQQVLAGKNVALNFTVEPDAFQWTGVTTREDLLVELQWIAATVTDSAFRPEIEPAVKARIGGLYAQLSHTAQGPLQTLLPRLLASNDRRFGYPPLAEVNRRTIREVRDWLAPQLSRGPMELTLVGDFDPDAAFSAIAQTLAALPDRQAPRPLDAQRLVSFPTPPQRWDQTVTSQIPAAAVAAYWPTDGSIDEHRRDRLELLAVILQDRVRRTLREQLGVTYTPDSSSYAPAAFPGFGYLRTQVTVDPGHADTAATVLAAIGASLARRSITADEVERARLPLAARAHDLEHYNPYWLDALESVQTQPYTLEWTHIHPSDFDAVTPTELNALAADIFRPGNFCVAIVRTAKE